jgi:hypothetical protein
MLLYLIRHTPRNTSRTHGGGIEGADAIWGYPPLDNPKDPPPANADRPEQDEFDPELN